MVRFFDTLKKQIVDFTPEKDSFITIYNCGPTTCSKHTSIGNLRSYLFSDILKRFFNYIGLSTKHVIKITDVDDRIIKEINGEKSALKEYNEKHIKDFQRMLNDVNALSVDYMPRVTENMKDIIDDIVTLEKKGYTYISSGSLYFDTTKGEDYGLLLGELNKKGLINAQNRLEDIENDNKRNPNDFCLWKAHIKEEGTVYWESPRGHGRPGRHSQCSTIARKYLGKTIDIHGGGMSHIFPHHENEKIQSEIITGSPFVKYWLHHEYVIFPDNYCITLDEVKGKGYDPLIVRLFLIKKHYRSKLNFTYESLNATRQDIKKIIKFILVLDSVKKIESVEYKIKKYKEECEEKIIQSLNDDINVSNAIFALLEFINNINYIITNISMSEAQNIKEFIFKLDIIFGFIKAIYQKHSDNIEIIIIREGLKKEIERWLTLRECGDFSSADTIRNKLKEDGIEIEHRKGLRPLLYISDII